MKNKNFTLSIKTLFYVLILLFFVAVFVQYFVLKKSENLLANSLRNFYLQVKNGEIKDSRFSGKLTEKEKRLLNENKAVFKHGLLLMKESGHIKVLRLKDDAVFKFGNDLILANIIFDLVLIWVALYFYFRIFIAITKVTTTMELSTNGKFVPEKFPEVEVEGVDRMIDKFKTVYVDLLEAEKQVQRKSQFEVLGLVSAKIIHDLKNTFTFLNIMIYRAKASEKPEEIKEILSAVDSKINSLKSVLQDVLIALKDGRNFEIEDVDIEVLKNGFEKEYSMLTKYLNIDFTVKFDENLMGHTLSVNPMQIKSAIDNLLDNSVKALKKSKSKNKKMELSFLLIDGNVEISVFDNAGGFEKAAKAEFFKEFNSGNKEGIGLGLNIVKEYVEVNGGELNAEFGDSMTRFIITLPLKKEK